MTIPTLTLLSLFLLQDPEPDAAAAPRTRLDVVELRGGEVLEGRIVHEQGNYLEIELAPGAVVGFRRSEVAAVRRKSGAAVDPHPGALLPPSDEWFTLHDAAGKAVGWLHATVTVGEDGGNRLLEEWEFSEDDRHFQVTVLEIADAAGAPVSCYYRERVSEEVLGGAHDDRLGRTQRVREERIVEATVRGPLLAVRRLSRAGRSERELPWPDRAAFPMLARATRGDAAGSVTVFDPALEELRTLSFDATRRRRVTVGGDVREVEETIERGAGARNAVWVDASAGVVRREIAGPGLVAVPAAAESARAAVRRGVTQPSLFAAEAQGRFGIWRPNPAWSVVPSEDGRLTLSCGLHGATITVALLDHLDPGATLDAAAAAVQRWLALLEPDQRIERTTRCKVRQREAVRLDASNGRGPGASRAVVVVLPWQEQFLVVRARAPLEAWDELAPDVEAAITRLELEPRGVDRLRVEEALAAGDRLPAGSSAPGPSPEQPAPPVPTTSGSLRPAAVEGARPRSGGKQPVVRLPRDPDKGR